jgi:hypothetical protein
MISIRTILCIPSNVKAYKHEADTQLDHKAGPSDQIDHLSIFIIPLTITPNEKPPLEGEKRNLHVGDISIRNREVDASAIRSLYPSLISPK